MTDQRMPQTPFEPKIKLEIASSRIVPRCSCQGELVIIGEERSPNGWRTGFKLLCKKCGRNWTYSGGVYRQATDEKVE